MKYFLLLSTMFTLGFSNMNEINSFEADFTQIVTNDANNHLKYKGHVEAEKPQSALWKYEQPSKKEIYIYNNKVTIVEPEIEQVVIKKIDSSFNFFNILKNAKLIDKNTYLAKFQKIAYKIKMKHQKIESISYQDELENNVIITFVNQRQNEKIDKNDFIPTFPLDYDIIED